MCGVLWISFLVGAATVTADQLLQAPDLSSEPVAVTTAGAVRGSWLYTRRGRPIEAYRGVRYAAPPVGDLRFQPPQPITQYEGEVNATVDGPACPQPTYGDYYVDEDCLRLNIYTPGKFSNLLPVIVFMHAGGFYSVSGRSDVAGPSYLLDKDIVLVTINYRLASLGFLSTGDRLAPGNNGFKDQVSALRWLRAHVAAFGGDARRVTLAGYSAGAFSVLLHMVSPMSKGLFHRAISMSGSPISQVHLPAHQRALGVKQAELLGCPTSSSREILNCLRTKTSKELGDSLDGFFNSVYDPVLVWVPIIEEDFGQERFLVEQPLKSLQEGRFHAVPYIVSQTHDEFFWKAYSILNNATLTAEVNAEWEEFARVAFLLPPPAPTTNSPPSLSHAARTLRNYYLCEDKHLHNDTETRANLGKLYSDAVIGFGSHTLANALAVYSPLPTYYYQFAYVGTHSHYVEPHTHTPTGAAHHDDLIYLFSINVTFPLIPAADTPDSRMVDRITEIWYNFARFGDPNPTPSLGVPWPRMSPSGREYLRIGRELSVRRKLFEERFHVWEKLFNPHNCAYCTY